MDQRLAAGFDIFHQSQYVNPYAEYATWTTGVNLRLGVAVTDELTFQPNYSIYQSAISIPNTRSQPYGDCAVANGNPQMCNGIIPGTVYRRRPRHRTA